MIFKSRNEVTELRHGRDVVMRMFHLGQMVYQAVVAYIFTSDGYGIKTQDDYVVKCSDQ